MLSLTDLPSIEDGDVVVYDVETNGVDWKKDHIVGFVITVVRDGRPKTKYYPTRHESGNQYDHNQVVDWVRSWSCKRITLVGHNLKFDLHMSANEGIFFPNAILEDTQVNACLIDEHQQSYSLDEVSRRAGVGSKFTDIYDHIKSTTGCKESGKATMAHFWRLRGDDELAIRYAEADGDTTYHVWYKQIGDIAHQGLQRVHHLERRVTRALFSMERRGVPVDPTNLAQLEDWLGNRISEARSRMPEPDFNVRSQKQIADYFRTLGVTDFPTTPLGNPSFTEDWLVNHEFGRDIITLRKLTNLVNSFVEGSVKNKLYHGRIHANFNQMFDGDAGTITGRLSCTDPNMQQVPKRDKLLAPIFRRIFVPEDGTVWSQNDYSQQEYRVFATYTGSRELIEKYRAGVDFHQYVADKIGVERDPTAKRLNLGMLYWMGVEKLAGELKIPTSEAKKLRDWYYEEIPAVKEFLYSAQAVAKHRGFVRTLFDRRARIDDLNYSYRAASRVIQGTCADITKLKMVEVNEFLEAETGGQCGVNLQIHDELDWFFPEGREDLDEEARRIMSNVGELGERFDEYVPMKVDYHHGVNWGMASFPNQDWSKYGVAE